ncbi:hypothetical protein F53441_3941 [Fusarium austroafricanum]|uniref:Uncharacterized protein n=1 Tax=Fusarium austroafricanum TaxID=2364996 RepID=A0A8H4KPL6_9HYPO|nr:hypothetical protein F53441_3941 [Fusarium austroafricanum]
MADHTDHRAKINPLMPPAKQERIHIWRTEVASALHLPTAPSVSSSLSSSSAATPDTDPDTSLATPPSPAGSRPRSLWKRISWRFGPKRRAAANMAAAAAELPPDGRTAMYRGLENRTPRGDDVEEEGGILERDSEQGNGLKEKQERLARAARLLNRRTEER